MTGPSPGDVDLGEAHLARLHEISRIEIVFLGVVVVQLAEVVERGAHSSADHDQFVVQGAAGAAAQRISNSS